jgi:hypothetical protein
MLRPVVVCIERHRPCFSAPIRDGGVDWLSIPFKHVGERRVVLARQRFGKGKFENILDSGKVLPIVCKPVIVLDSSPVERRLNILPDELVVVASLLASTPPIRMLVPRKKASSVFAWVIFVFSSLSVSLRRSFRKVLISCLISEASA